MSSYLQTGICFDVEDSGAVSSTQHQWAVPLEMKTVCSGLERVDIYHHSLSTPACRCVHGSTGNDSLSSQG
jgi:hypothetical protein